LARLQALEQNLRAAQRLPMLGLDAGAPQQLGDDLAQDDALGEVLRADLDRVGAARHRGDEQHCHDGERPGVGDRFHSRIPSVAARIAWLPTCNRWALTKRRTKSSAGVLMKSFSVPFCTMRPSPRSRTSSPKNPASPMSCVTRTTILFSLRKISFRSCCNSARTSGSRAPIGSSSSSTAGASLSARTMPTPCLLPPDT